MNIQSISAGVGNFFIVSKDLIVTNATAVATAVGKVAAQALSNLPWVGESVSAVLATYPAITGAVTLGLGIALTVGISLLAKHLLSSKAATVAEAAAK